MEVMEVRGNLVHWKASTLDFHVKINTGSFYFSLAQNVISNCSLQLFHNNAMYF